MAQEGGVLIDQGFVQTQLGAQGEAGGRRGAGAEQGIDRIAGGDAQQQEHQCGDQPEHQRRQGEPGPDVAQQFGTAAHGRPPSSLSTTRPEPSNRGWLTGGRLQATGATSQIGT